MVRENFCSDRNNDMIRNLSERNDDTRERNDNTHHPLSCQIVMQTPICLLLIGYRNVLRGNDKKRETTLGKCHVGMREQQC